MRLASTARFLSALRAFTVFVFVPMRMIVIMSGFVQMLVRIMKMHVAFAPYLPHKIVEAEKQKRAAGNARKPGADRFAERRAKQSNY